MNNKVKQDDQLKSLIEWTCFLSTVARGSVVHSLSGSVSNCTIRAACYCIVL